MARVFFLKLGFIAFLPFVLVLVSLAFWKSYAKIKKQPGLFKNRFMSTMIILLFLVHPTIVEYMFDAFNCVDIDGQARMLSDLEVVCWEGPHILWGYTCAVPSIFAWGLGIPLLAYLSLKANSSSLNTRATRERYGFLFNGYKLKYYYWEVVIMYRKIFIIFISIFLRKYGIIS